MFRRIRFIVFTVLVMVMSTATIHADRLDTGWKGYGLYNLNKSEVSVESETDTVTVNGANVTAVYEYSIKNNSNKDITVNFGYPNNGIYQFSVHDGSKFLKYKTRDTSYLKENYGVTGLQTPDGNWYLFNMVFTPGQTRSIKVNMEAEMKRSDNDTYPLGFYKDRSYTYAAGSKSVKLKLKFAGFKPYSILELVGLKPEDLSSDGTVALSYSGSYGNGISLAYQPVDTMAIEKLNASTYKKLKAIAKAFSAKNYAEAIKLCDEYISAPTDERLSLEQVKYVKAESSRLVNNSEEYLKSVEQLDISKLYPARLRYKVLHDSLKIYDSSNNEKAKEKILVELLPETQKGSPYFYHWLVQNGFKLSEANNETVNIPSITGTPPVKKPSKGFDVLGATLRLFENIGKSRWTYGILGLIVGFIIGRKTKRGKKQKSVYLFRD